LLTTINATDKDDGENAKLTFSFINDTASFSLPFCIKPDTGTIKLCKKLDREKVSKYQVNAYM